MNAVPLAGKVAVVSGASRGLGKRICEAFAEVGMTVAMLSPRRHSRRRPPKLVRPRQRSRQTSRIQPMWRAPYPFLSVYAATKAAVETLSAGLRTELRGENIRVTILRSGRMSESGFNRHWPEARRVRYRELVQSQGFYAQSGEPISPQIPARAIVDDWNLYHRRITMVTVGACRAAIPELLKRPESAIVLTSAYSMVSAWDCRRLRQ